MANSKDEWVKPREAVSIIAPFVGGDSIAKLLLAERFRDGAITLSTTYVTESVDSGPVPLIPIDSHLNKSDAQNIPVDRGFPEVSETKFGARYVLVQSALLPEGSIVGPAIPRYSANWEKDVGRWDWGFGIFVFSKPAVIRGKALPAHIPFRFRYSTRMVIYGVTFKRSEINKMAAAFRPSQPYNPSKTSSKTKRRVPRKYDWTDMYMSLAALAYVSNLDQKFGKMLDETGWQAALEVWIAEYFENNGIDINESMMRVEAKRFIEAIWQEKIRLQ